MLEHFCAQSRNVMVAKSKAKRRKSTKKKNKPEKEKEQTTAIQKSLDERWDDAGPELSAVMQDGTIPDVIPFDATLDTPIEDQKYVKIIILTLFSLIAFSKKYAIYFIFSGVTR